MRLCQLSPTPTAAADSGLDASVIGVPTEGLGYSGITKLFLAPPSQQETAVQVEEASAELETNVTCPSGATKFALADLTRSRVVSGSRLW
ncbi:MAG: hypothetical protein AAF495_01090 [Pseudomonadota bacterium]